MIKDKWIWAIIGCILVIGMGVTCYTNSFTRTAVSADLAAALPAEGAPEQETAQSFSAAAPRMARSGGSGETAAFLQEETSPDAEEPLADQPAPAALTADEPPLAAGATPEEPASEEAMAAGAQADEAQEAETLISPLEGGNQSVLSSGTDYRQRLETLDSQITRMRAKSEDTSAYSAKASAETEFRLWDSELNTIYNALRGLLPEEESLALAREQREWIADRDARAAEDTGKNTGMDGTGYMAAMAQLTRDRAYELAERCEQMEDPE